MVGVGLNSGFSLSSFSALFSWYHTEYSVQSIGIRLLLGVKKAEGEERSSEEGCKRKSPSATEQREKEKKEGTRSPFHATCLLLPTPYLVVVVLPGTPHVRNTLVARSTCTSSPPLLPRTTVLRTTIVVLLPSLTLPTASTASHPLPFLKLYLNHPAPHRTHFHPLRLASSP